MSLVKSIKDCLLEYDKAVLDICEAAEGFEASTAYSNKLAVLKKLDLAINQEISKSVEEALIELAAKAAGIGYRIDGDRLVEIMADGRAEWNPLTDNGDAFRRESDLRLDVRWGNGSVTVGDATERYSDGDDAAAVKRRAIVKAAASIGKDLP